MVLTIGDRVITMPSWVYYPVALIGYAMIGLIALPAVAILILADWILPR